MGHLHEIARKAFGRLVVEKCRTRISDLKEFPRYVIEYLINQFCPGEDFETEIASVRRKLASNYASPADAPRILHQLKQKRKLDLIARTEVRLETSEDKYWASIAALNERFIHVGENLINQYPRLMGGMWGIAELAYDEAQVWKNKITPLLLSDFTPFQHSRIDLEEFQQKRSIFTRGQMAEHRFDDILAEVAERSEAGRWFLKEQFESLSQSDIKNEESAGGALLRFARLRCTGRISRRTPARRQNGLGLAEALCQFWPCRRRCAAV